MLDKLDKKQKIIIAVSVVLFVILFIIIIISMNNSKKNENKVKEIYLQAKAIDENTINLEIEAPKSKTINYIIEKSNTLNFEEKEEVKGTTNTPQVKIDTQDVDKTTYYRVKMEDTETKEIIYSNVISISKKEEIEQEENEQEEDENELEIAERSDEKKKSKSSEKSKVTNSLSSSPEKSTKSNVETSSSSSSKEESEYSSEETEESEESEFNEEYESEQEEYEESSSTSSTTTKKSSSSKKASKSSTSSKKNTETKSTTKIEIKNEEKIIEVESVKISASTVELDMSKKTTKTLKAAITPSNATNKKVEWSSENENIAKVDTEGKITAVSNGTTNIIVKVGKKQAKCRVKVITTATGIKIDKTSIKIDLTESKQAEIKAEVEPNTATSGNITWTSQNTKIARVDSNGKVTGVSNGTTNIIAKIGTVTKKCKVIVETSPKSLKLNQKNVELDINQQNQIQIKTKITPETSSYTKIIWKTSNKKVATVDKTGKVTAVGVGTAKITAQIEGKEAIKNTVKVVVNSSISSIELSKQSIELDLLKNPKTEVKAKIKSGEEYGNITWTSSNPSIVKIQENGLQATIIAQGAGETIITANIDGKKAISQVTVKKGKLEITKTNENVLEADGKNTTNIKIKNQKNPKDVIYTSSDPNKATVDSNGIVTGKKAGKVKIKVETNYGIGECEVTVWYKTGIIENKNNSLEYFLYVPDSKIVDVDSEIPLIVDFEREVYRNVVTKLDNTLSSRKKEFNAIILSPGGENVVNKTDKVNNLVGEIIEKYKINRKKISAVGYSYGTYVTWSTAAKVTKEKYKNLQFCCIVSMGTPAYTEWGEEFSWLIGKIETIRSNKVNCVPVFIVVGEQGWHYQLEDIAQHYIGLYNSNSNNKGLTARFKYLAGAGHGGVQSKAFTIRNNSYDLVKWMQQQERTVVY